MAVAQPAISSMVLAFVDFVDSAAKNAAVCTGVVAPDIISQMVS